jgi:hypothetical protein
MSESQKLLHEHPSDSDSEAEHERKASPRHLSPSPASSRTTSASPAPPGSRPNGNIKRQSSFAQPRPDGAPRTPNRVRFEEPRRSMNGDSHGGDWLEMDGDDYMDGDDGRERVQRLPLLTGIEAPSVTVAEQSFNPEDHLENAQPRSGMRSAFMNMANSIMYAPEYRDMRKEANTEQRSWYHRPAVRCSQCRPPDRHRPPHRPYRRSRLDHTAYRHKLQTKRYRFVPSHGATLFWEIGVDSDIPRAMGLVRSLYVVWNEGY